MTQKLARNLSDPRWCEFWMRVEAAAARARKLHYEEKHRASEASKKPVHPKASTRSKAK